MVTGSQAWKSLTSNLQITDILSVAYDPLSQEVLGGTNGLGPVQQVGTSLPATSATLQLTFVDSNPGTIVRSSGDWSADGFVSGQRIWVSGSNSNDGIYTIATVKPTTLTLSSTDRPKE